MNDNNLNLKVSTLILEKNKEKINSFIEGYIPFIIKTISNEKKSYISIDNDEEYSIGLLAFHESMEKYNYDSGNFLPFARLVIISRLRNFWKKEKKYSSDSIEKLSDDGIQIADTINPYNDLKLELEEYENELLKFGINFEILVDNTPKHKDTKKNAIKISKKVSFEDDLVEFIYLKKRLPITKISTRFNVTQKILKGSKIFILSVVIVFIKKFNSIIEWIDT